MEPLIIKFQDDTYRDKRIADSVDGSTKGIDEEGLDTFVKNIFRKKG